MSEPLTPTLTAHDRRVLAMLPDFERGLRSIADTPTAWQIAERLGTEDVAGVREQLVGLEQFGYAHGVAHQRLTGRARVGWYRSDKGDEEVW